MFSLVCVKFHFNFFLKAELLIPARFPSLESTPGVVELPRVNLSFHEQAY